LLANQSPIASIAQLHPNNQPQFLQEFRIHSLLKHSNGNNKSKERIPCSYANSKKKKASVSVRSRKNNPFATAKLKKPIPSTISNSKMH
jgi:hypothetical protein